jgi:PAS domain S-box-containing protein
MNKSKKKIFLRVPKIFLKAKDPVFPGIFHKSEELIDEPQIRYRTLSDSGRALIWTSGVDKKRDYFNKPWLDFTGRTMEQESGDGWAEGLHPDDDKIFLETYSEAFERRERFSVNYRLSRYDNEYRWIQDDCTPMFNSTDEFIGYIGYCLDITELKIKEVTFRESEELYRIFINSTEDLVFLKDEHFRYVIVNKANASFFKKSETEIIGKTDYELMSEDAAKNCHSTDKLALSSDKVIIHEERVGDKVYETRKFKILFKNGSYGIGGYIRDMTKEMTAQVALRESEHLFNTLTTISPVGIFHTSPDGRTTYVNPTWCHLAGLSAERAINNGWLSAVHPEDRKKIVVKWQSAVKNQSDSVAEYRFLHPDGSIVYIIGNASPEFDSNKQIVGYVGTITDITELKKLERNLILAKEKAEESDRLKTAFLHNISHEIRTPMNAIVGFSSLLGEPDITHEEQISFINTVQQSSNHLLSIITDIINISNIEANIIKINNRQIDINSKMRSLYNQFLQVAKGKNLSLSCELTLSDEKSIILTDGTKLSEIMSNLISNALKFTEHGSIKFGYTPEDSFIRFYVYDTGIGIPSDKHTKIFDRFYQIDNSVTRIYEGTGLGLTICKSYVELLGGKIWLTSETGNGSVFYFTIPYSPESVTNINNELVVSEKGEFADLKNLKILVVEDDENSYSLLSKTLNNFSSEIIHAKTGIEAVESCHNNPDLDLVLMDIMMPIMDGYEATRQIRQFDKNVIIIAQTSFAFSDEKEKTIDAGCNDFISKPIDKTLLLRLIKKHCNKQRLKFSS